MTNRTLAPLLTSSLLALGLAACGGSAPGSSSSSHAANGSSASASAAGTTSSRPTAVTASTSKPGARTGRTQRHGKAKLHAVVYNPPPPTRASSPAIPRPGSAQDPCRLVTSLEASAILHASTVREVVGSLGPTCLLEPKDRKTVTLAVQTVHLQRELAQMKRKPARLSVGGHTAYCGVLGSSLLFVDLGNERVLQVSASCSTAKALAAAALPRIRA